MNKVVLIVLDGFGLAPPGPGNAVYLANPTNFNNYMATYPHTSLKASGEAVGLPSSEVGNTEVGHINIGAGRVVHQDLPRINMSIADGSFYQNRVFLDAADHVKKNNSNFHIIGLLSEGIVHSALDHLFALLYFAKENAIKNVFIHAITDGRDSPPKSSVDVIRNVENKLKQLNIGKIATVSGRYYAMDRDNRWERTAKSYFCMSKGDGEKAESAVAAVENAYRNNLTDEFILPTNVLENNQPVGLVSANDAAVFLNYRIDRARQLTKAFVLDEFEKTANENRYYDPFQEKYLKTHLPQKESVNPPFTRGPKIENLYFATMTEYEENLPVCVAFHPIVVNNPLGQVLESANINQLRLAESEKERFVTFYFNGQREMPFSLEDRIIIPSPKVPTYDLKPEMSSFEITETLIQKMKEDRYRFILVNFACPDMVGHTGNIQATIMAIKAIDQCLAKIVQEAFNQNTTVLIVADHGNAEQKISPTTGEISTEHTANLVPFIAIDKKLQGKFNKLSMGILADVAPTVLALLGIPKPENMTGRNLLEELS